MIQVFLGNVAPHDTLNDENKAIFERVIDGDDSKLAAHDLERYGEYLIRPRLELGEARTEFLHPNEDIMECITNIKKAWAQHSTQNPGWVYCDNKLVAEILANTFPGCQVVESLDD